MPSILSSTNLSLYTIPAAWVLSIAPHFYAMSLSGKKFDARTPRQLISSLENDQTVDTATKGLIARAEGAQQNNFENLGVFAAAVVAGNLALASPKGFALATLNKLSLGYLAIRTTYNIIYINNTTEGMAGVRTLVYLSGVGVVMTLFVGSGRALSL